MCFTESSTFSFNVILYNLFDGIGIFFMEKLQLCKMTVNEKVQFLLKSMTWKAHLFDNNDFRQSNLLNYIFKSRKLAIQHEDL